MSVDQSDVSNTSGKPDHRAVRRGINVLFVFTGIALLFAGRYHYQEFRYSSEGRETTGYVTNVVPSPLSEDSFVMTVTYADQTSRSHTIRVNEVYYDWDDAYDEVGSTRVVHYLSESPGTGRIPGWFNPPIWVGYALAAIPALIGLLGRWGMGSSRGGDDHLEGENQTERPGATDQTQPHSELDELYQY